MSEDDRLEDVQEESDEVETEKPEESPTPEELYSQQEEEIQSLRKQIDELNAQSLRKQADTENYRKRILREKEDAVTYANKQLLLDIITVIDDFERAIQSSESAENFDSLHDGIVMIEKQFIDMLKRKWHLVRFEADGQDFDPEKHEALMVEERSDVDRQTVLQVIQQGYMLKDSILRAAKVKVSQPVSSNADSKELNEGE